MDDAELVDALVGAAVVVALGVVVAPPPLPPEEEPWPDHCVVRFVSGLCYSSGEWEARGMVVDGNTHDCRTRNGVVIEVIVDVHCVTRLCAVDEAGDGDEGPRCTAAASCYGNLCAGDVELGCSGWVWVVDS